MSSQSYIYNPQEDRIAATGAGFQLPRLTTTQRLATVVGPGDAGLTVFDITLSETFVWTGSAWIATAGSGGDIETVDNIAALKALPVAGVPDGQVIATRGYYTENDGGQGTYIYDSGSVAADNGGTVIAPTVGAGRYLLQVAGSVNVRQFGAKGDGATDDTAAVQSAANWCLSTVSMVITSGSYRVTGGALSIASTTVVFSGGLLVVVGSTLNITTPVSAPPVQIFSSSLSTPVRFARAAGSYIGPSTSASNVEVFAEWFGANGNGVFDNATALQQWINSIGNGMTASLVGGSYATTTGFVWPSGMRFVTVKGNNSKITYTGALSATTGVLQMTNAGNILGYRCEIKNICFDANGLAGYAILARSSGGTYSINTLRWHECMFTNGTVANVLAGDYSYTNNDCDFAHWQFNHCLFYGINGSVNLIADAPNIVGMQLSNCVLGAINPASDRPKNNAQLLSGANITFDTCFLDRVQLGNFSILNKGIIATLSGCDTESARLLWQESSTNLANLETSIRTLRLSNAGNETPSGSYCIWALAGTVVLEGAVVVSGGSPYGVRCDGRLVTNGSWIGGHLTGSTTSAADVTVPTYCSLVIDGKRADDVAFLNSNRYFDLWYGSASGDLPLGFSASAIGSATIIRAGTTSADFPKNNYGRFCAKITVATGATSGSVLDGIFCRAWAPARRGAGPYVAMVSGFIEGASGTNSAPSVSVAVYTWSGAAWTVSNSQVRVCSVDSSGRFWGVATVSASSGGIQSGFVEAHCGMGNGSSGIIYLSELSIIRSEGSTIIDSANASYPDFGRLKALSVVPKTSTLNGSFSDSSWWELGSGWAVSGSAANHSSGTASLVQEIGLSPRSRRMLLSFKVSGMTAGSVTPRVSGTSGNAVSNSAASTQVTFTVSGVGVVPTAGATYTVGGVTYTVVWATSTRIRATGGVPTTASGTLTKTAGTGDATISFSAIDATQIVEILGGTGMRTTFNVRGVVTPPAVGDTYTVGGVTYTITSASSTVIVATATTTSIPSLGPSTMTRVTGAGDASITYQSSVATSLLEFVPTNDFNGSVTAVQLQFPVTCGSDVSSVDFLKSGQVPLTVGSLLVGAAENIQPPIIAQGSAAPLVGTWRAGSVIYNSAPALGQPTYWVCTVDGTPGTWVAGPNL